MHRLLWALFLSLTLFPSTVEGCGDKLLVLGRSVRFSLLSSDRPATILAYAPVGSVLARILQDPQWLTAIVKGKHRLSVIRSAEELQGGLTREHYDLILMNLADAAGVKQREQTTLKDFVIVPTVDASTQDQIQRVDREYGVVLKSGSKTKAYLSEISRAVELRDRRMEALLRARKNNKS